MNFGKNHSPTIDDNDSTRKNCKSYQIHDFYYSIRCVRCLLRILGIWYRVVEKPKSFERHLSKLTLPVVSISMITMPLPICCHVIFRTVDHFEMIILLGPITFQSANIMIHFVLLIRSSALKRCIQHMESDWKEIENQREYDIMKEHVRFSHVLTIICIFFMYGSAISYFLIMPFLAGSSINEKNETIRPRPFPGTELFFNVQANVVYEIVFTLDFISALFHFTVTTAVCTLAIVLVSHACGQIKFVIWNLENFIDQIANKNDAIDAIRMRMRIIIRKHVRLIKFAATVDKALKEIFLLEVVTSTLIICFVEYDIIIVSDQTDSDFVGTLTYTVLLTAFAFKLFLFCRFGEVLKEQSQMIGKVAYMADWYRLPTKNRPAIMMIIQMANSPCELTAGGMMELSIASFAKIIKTSFAYFNMLRKTA